MSVTILECLQNAQHNLVEARNSISLVLGKQQLNNAIVLLEKGYSISDEVEPLLEMFGDIDKVPVK